LRRRIGIADGQRATTGAGIGAAAFCLLIACFRRAAKEHDPEKACPGLDPGWTPVFRKIEPKTS
jgi:hypothetical protein